MEIKEINIRDITGHMDRFHDIEKTITSGNVFSILFKNGDGIAFNTDHLICIETIYDEDYINAHK